jgi:hypothetical protein
MPTIVRATLVARSDPSLSATLDRLTPLFYCGGASPNDDRPAHVRAASAVRRMGSRILIVQDDVNILALRDENGEMAPLMLPVGPGGRRVFDDTIGNKKGKMDLEACASLPDGRLVAFGSGSSRAREILVIVEEGKPALAVGADLLYEALRSERAFAGSELNLEGAVVRASELLLFQRGNGAQRGPTAPVNAIGSMDVEDFTAWLDGDRRAPRLTAVTPVDLGAVAGTRFGFTDATLMGDGRLAILACAEDSPDAVNDGPVLGLRFGIIDRDELRMTDVLDDAGRPPGLKLEGIESRPGSTAEFDVVADVDRPSEPARLGRLRISE